LGPMKGDASSNLALAATYGEVVLAERTPIFKCEPQS
jgi:hypothetical protein